MNARRSRQSAARQLALHLGLLVLGVAALAAVARLVVYQGLLRPVRVSSGSMAETFVGEHYQLVCADCGLKFACDRDGPPRDMLAVCPNCGYADIGLDDDRLVQGERVLIDHLATLAPLRRWQVVAFNDPGVPQQLTVKRIVGLPGEQVAIHGGDIYIDGRLTRKNLAEQRELAVLVHDNDFRPRPEAHLPPRWQADAPHSRWQANAGRFRYEFASPSESDAEPTEDAPPIDWLTYRQWRCVVRPPRTAEAPVRDSYGYNQGVPRHLQEVTDLMLVCRLTLSGPGGFVLRCDNGRATIAAVLEPAQDRLTVLQGAQTIATADLPEDLTGRPIELVFSLFDEQAIVAIDGGVLITKPLAPSDAPFTPTSRPLALGARGVDVTINRLQIYRDLFYLDPLNQGVPWEAAAPLAPDELFVLGDNAPISRDSRVFPRPLKQADVVGGILRFATNSHGE